jgi:hypothetical protein
MNPRFWSAAEIAGVAGVGTADVDGTAPVLHLAS